MGVNGHHAASWSNQGADVHNQKGPDVYAHIFGTVRSFAHIDVLRNLKCKCDPPPPTECPEKEQI